MLHDGAGSPGVARVEAHANVVVTYRLPQRAVIIQILHHRVAAARRVLDEDRHRHIEGVQRLAPPVEPDSEVLVVLNAPAVHDHP